MDTSEYHLLQLLKMKKCFEFSKEAFLIINNFFYIILQNVLFYNS